MPRHVAEEDWDDESEWNESEDNDYSSDDEAVTIPCPYCRKHIHEDAPRCPYCEQYISEEDAPPSRKPWWFLIGAILCLIIVYCWIAG